MVLEGVTIEEALAGDEFPVVRWVDDLETGSKALVVRPKADMKPSDWAQVIDAANNLLRVAGAR